MNIEMTRRNLLKSVGLGAGALALDPIFGQLAAAEAKPAKPLRVVFVIQSNGFMFQHAVPSGIKRPANDAKSYDKPIDVSLKEKEFHPALEPLAAFKDRICLVQNLSNRIAYSDHSCCFGVLGCSPKGEAWGPSADLLVSEALPAAFKHVGLGYSDTHSDTYTISASAKGKPVPILHSPLEANKSLFGSATDAGVKTFDTRTKILEFMADDVKRSRAALPGNEGQKLDSYAEAFETLRERQGKLLANTEHRLKSVKKEGVRITELVMENGNVFRAKVFIDTTYEGDLMAMAKCSFFVGRESNEIFKETVNGIWAAGGHDFKLAVDPYVKPGDPSSGLLKEISAADAGKKGDGDQRIQAYCFRMRLTTKADRLPFPKPKGYDAERYLLLARYLHQLGPDPKNKGHAQLGGDTNNHHLANGAMFIDYVGGSDGWPDGDYPTREKIYQSHVTYQMGVMYFLTHDERVPEEVRAEFTKWGLPADEYKHTGGWTHQLYIREGRRMISDYVMTEHDCTGKAVAEDPIGLATYNMDSHHCQRVVKNGHVVNEGNVEAKVKPYGIAYRAITPSKNDCENLLVPVCCRRRILPTARSAWNRSS